MQKAPVYELRQKSLELMIGDSTFKSAMDTAVLNVAKNLSAAEREYEEFLTDIQSGPLPDCRYELYLGADCGEYAGRKLGIAENFEVVFLTEEELNDANTPVVFSQWDCFGVDDYFSGNKWLRFRNAGTAKYLGVSKGWVDGHRFVLTAKDDNISKSTLFLQQKLAAADSNFKSKAGVPITAAIPDFRQSSLKTAVLMGISSKAFVWLSKAI